MSDYDPYDPPGSRRLEQKSRKLAEDLAGQLRVAKERHIVWTETGLPDGGRADVFAIRPSWGKRDLRIYEVKASRSDFLRDVNSDKWRRYLPFCNRLYFACPSGLVKRNEVPEGCGLITRNENGWRVTKPPTPREIETPSFDWLVTLLDRCWFKDTLEVRRLREITTLTENAELRLQTWRLGDEVARKLRIADDPDRMEAQSVEARNALHVVESLRALAEAAGVRPRYPGLDGEGRLDLGDLSEFLEEAAAFVRNAEYVNRIGQTLSRLRFVTRRESGKVQALLAEAPE